MFDMFQYMPMPLAWVQFVFALFVDILWAAAISYGAALVAQQFGKKPKQRLPDLGGYPIQTSQKGIAIPKVYGCERVAGNVIWMGEQHSYEKKTHQPHIDGHVIIKTYYKDFLIGIAEGSGNITKIWDGKTLVYDSSLAVGDNCSTVTVLGFPFTFCKGTTYKNNDTQTVQVGPAGTSAESPSNGAIRISKGDETQDARFYTGEDFGKYDDLIWAYFKGWETGSIPNIPNFSFEICEQTGYRYTYISENGSIWGIPLFGTLIQSLDEDGVAVNVGGGVVGLPMASTPFKAGETVRITNTTNYNGSFVLGAGTTDNQLQITDGYVAETFDGTEVIVKYIGGLMSGGGDMVQGPDGTVYYAHVNFGTVPNVYYITKIKTDGTLSPDYEWLDIEWTDVSADTRGIAVTADGAYLYIAINVNGPTNYVYVAKFNLSTGATVWSNWDPVFLTSNSPGYDLAIDADGNAYIPGNNGRNVLKYASADGARTKIDLPEAAYAVGGFVYEIEVDDSQGKVVVAGRQYCSAAYDPTGIYNMVIMDLDGGNQIPVQVGGYYLSSLYYTPNIGTGCIAISGNYIYILTFADGITATIYKYDFEGTEITSAAVSTYAVGLYFDLSGNIVVVNQDWISHLDDVLYFYDTDLNYLSKIDGMYTLMLSTWDASAGGAWIQGNAVFFPGIGSGDKDANPAAMIDDLARNDRYGAGIAQAYINDAAVLEEFGYWAAQNNEISLALTEQLPFMDWVDFILSHCNGFRFWSEGKFHIGAFKDEASIVSLDQDDLVRDEGDDPPPPVQIVKRKASETTNRVEVSWVDRSNTYDASVAMSKDDVDQRVSGKVRINPIDLRGIHNATLAEKQAYRLLFEGMYRFTIYSFDVSYKNMLYTVGDVIDVSDGGLLTSQRMRIIAREEDKDGRMIHIEAVEDVSELYPSIAYNTQETLAVPDTPTGSDDLVSGTLSFRENVNDGVLYMFFAPGDTPTDGAFIYRSYDNVNFLFVGRIGFDKDSITNAAGTTTSALNVAESVVNRYDEFFTVDIGTINTLRTDVTEEMLFAQQNMCKVGDEIIGWKTAEDQGSGIWKVSNLIRGMFGTGGNAHAIGATFATVSLIDMAYIYDTEVSGQTVYFKALATADKVSQTLADVTATQYTVINEHERPYPMSLPTVRDNVFGEVASYPVTIDFKLPSKLMGYNLGGFDEGGWGEFVKDTRLTSVLVTLKTLAGVEISQAIYSLDGYHADDYDLTLLEVDRSGNDPVDVILQPVTSLASVKESNVVVDII